MTEAPFILVPASGSVKSLKGIIPRPKKPVSLDDMQAAIEAAVTNK